jgi:hypothetical protein
MSFSLYDYGRGYIVIVIVPHRLPYTRLNSITVIILVEIICHNVSYRVDEVVKGLKD